MERGWRASSAALDALDRAYLVLTHVFPYYNHSMILTRVPRFCNKLKGRATMGSRADALATRFEQSNQEFIQAVEPISPEDWHKVCPAENWTVGVTAHHVAYALPTTVELTQAMAAGQTPEVSWDMINEINAKHAREFANCTKEDTLQSLETNGAHAANALRSLDDDALDVQHSMPMFGPGPITVEQFVEYVVIGNHHAHLPSIRAAAPSAG
jgi:hypothetical protein